MSDLARDPHVEAREKGLVAVLPEEDQLFLDIDHTDDLKVMRDVIKVLRHNGFVIWEERRTTSKSGNVHVYLRCERALGTLERVLLQACLGSDRKREVLSYLRERAGNFAPTVFFEKE